jgi:hypothetical protein
MFLRYYVETQCSQPPSLSLSHTHTSASSLSSAQAEGGGADSEAQRKRVGAVIERRRLFELAKQQAEEIEFLKAELERCRKRTFPSFQQIVPAGANPDARS